MLIALLVCGGGAVYPVGWDNRELKQSCGNSSAVYKLGEQFFFFFFFLLVNVPVRNNLYIFKILLNRRKFLLSPRKTDVIQHLIL